MSVSETEPKELNMRSITALVFSVGVAIVGLFILPLFQSYGLSFRVSFALVLVIEFVGLIGVCASVLTLHRERTID
jgi:hypothetical protein